MNRIVDSRDTLVALLSAAVGFALLHRMVFPEHHPLLQLILLNRPQLFYGIKYAYLVSLFTTPFITFSVLFSLLYIFGTRARKDPGLVQLPMYPEPTGRDRLYIVLGEVHYTKRPEPVPNPRWLAIPERGLYTGIAIFGAIGSGKTSGCMFPFAEQIFGYRAEDKERRIGGLMLEVKGDFCEKVKRILESCGRGDDYVEISLDSPYRYNPLHNDLDAYALAYGIASLLNNLFGKGKEPFWQQAYTNLVKFIILLHKVLYDYVTLFDVYECAINPDLLEQKIVQGDTALGTQYVLIGIDDFLADRNLEAYPFEKDPEQGRMKAPDSQKLRAYLTEHLILHEVSVESTAAEIAAWTQDEEKRQQFEAVKRWFYQDWKRIDARLRTSIVEGISVFLSLFDDNPAVKRVFCPPKETYDPVANQDGRYGKPLPSFSVLIETGAVCALNFPISANPGLAKAIGTLLKQDFQRSVLNRIPRIERQTDRHWREVFFLCDEYQAFATVGENDPSGDEKFFALARQAKCISIVATQSISSLRSSLPGESWRTLLQTFRTKIFLALSDDFSARTASELCGKEEQLKPNYNIAENGQDAGVSVLTGRATSHRSTLSTSKGYSVQRDFTFEPKIFSELRNAQAIVLAYDGLNPHPPTYCYLKPYYLDKNSSYFEQLAKGEI
ncbi:MAG: TraM recognition domain-containing protein [Acidobacteriia bacterium]|nr:TraM recognition domain-containing protein [Terriglobia bacterium]